MTARQAEELARNIVEMNRTELVQALRSLPCTFEMDFSDEALAAMDTSHIQHIVLAAALQAKEDGQGAAARRT